MSPAMVALGVACWVKIQHRGLTRDEALKVAGWAMKLFPHENWELVAERALAQVAEEIPYLVEVATVEDP